MDTTLDIYIGYDPRESVAYHTLVQSLMDNSSLPIRVTPLNLNNLHEYTRTDRGSTDFAFSRFLVPYLNKFNGLALFLDCDMLFTDDPVKLFSEFDYKSSVQVVQHDYTPRTTTKFLGQKNEAYPRKNWSSVMLFNCPHYHCRKLTPEVVNSSSGAYLHRFEWTDRVGRLSPEWNYLVGEDQPKLKPKNIHYTLGGPYFDSYKDCEFSREWFEAKERMERCDQ